MTVYSFWRRNVPFIQKKNPYMKNNKRKKLFFLWKNICTLGVLKIIKIDKSLGMSC